MVPWLGLVQWPTITIRLDQEMSGLGGLYLPKGKSKMAPSHNKFYVMIKREQRQTTKATMDKSTKNTKNDGHDGSTSLQETSTLAIHGGDESLGGSDAVDREPQTTKVKGPTLAMPKNDDASCNVEDGNVGKMDTGETSAKSSKDLPNDKSNTSGSVDETTVMKPSLPQQPQHVHEKDGIRIPSYLGSEPIRRDNGPEDNMDISNKQDEMADANEVRLKSSMPQNLDDEKAGISDDEIKTKTLPAVDIGDQVIDRSSEIAADMKTNNDQVDMTDDHVTDETSSEAHGLKLKTASYVPSSEAVGVENPLHVDMKSNINNDDSVYNSNIVGGSSNNEGKEITIAESAALGCMKCQNELKTGVTKPFRNHDANCPRRKRLPTPPRKELPSLRSRSKSTSSQLEESAISQLEKAVSSELGSTELGNQIDESKYPSSCIVKLPQGASTGDILTIRWPTNDESSEGGKTDITNNSTNDVIKVEVNEDRKGKKRTATAAFGKVAPNPPLLVKVTLPKIKKSNTYIKVFAPWVAFTRAVAHTLTTRQLNSIGINGQGGINANLRRSRRQQIRNHGEGNFSVGHSRIGERYQVTAIPSPDTWEKLQVKRKESVVVTDDGAAVVKMNDQIWDKALAEEAQQGGAPLDEFMDSLHTYQKARGIMALHESSYKVDDAERKFNKETTNMDIPYPDKPPGSGQPSSQKPHALLEGTPL